MNNQKRKIVQVDEDKLKRMIAGEEEDELVDQEQTKDKKLEINNDKQAKIVEIENNQGVTTVRKKKMKMDYPQTYLKLNKPIQKRPTTIQLSEDNYKKIGNLLMLTPGVSIAMFVNNVLEVHFVEYEEDITEVIKRSINKLKNNE